MDEKLNGAASVSSSLKKFYEDRAQREVCSLQSEEWLNANRDFIKSAFQHSYMYDFDWLGRPIIQLPADMVLVQHLVWQAKPTLIIETGVAHGGSLIASASLMAMLDYCEWRESGDLRHITESSRRVIGVDVDIKEYNRALIETHPMSSKLTLIEGDSTSAQVIAQVRSLINTEDRVMVLLDSNHAKQHVINELENYSHFVTHGSYIVAFDTVVEDFPVGHFANRPWGRSNGPLSAVEDFLAGNPSFSREPRGNKLAMNGAARFGVLKRDAL